MIPTNNPLRQFTSWSLLGITILAFSATGCEKTYVKEEKLLPNVVYKMAIFQQSPEEYEEDQIETTFDETQQMVTQMFGSLGKEKFPTAADLFASDEEKEEYDEFSFAGAVERNQLAKGGELYRKHCTICHGLNGNGRGPSYASGTPYPRDYRAGKFKFKNSVKGQKPLVEDITRVIKNGIPGTIMGKINELQNDDDIAAVADYVIYLSARGEAEREILKTAAFDLDLFEEHILPSANEDEDIEADLAGLVDEVLMDVFFSWDDAESEVEAMEIPEAFANQGSEEWNTLVAAGLEVYKSKTGACFTCHDKAGEGPPREPLYDEWSKEWTSAIQIDPKDFQSQIPYVARGARPPKELTARLFGAEPLRDGEDPRRIYIKIAYGIEGTPMPKATLNAEEIWAAVAYVMEETKKVTSGNEPETEPVPEKVELSSK